MRDDRGYVLVKIGKISEDKLRKCIRAGKLSMKADDLKGTTSVLVHPIAAMMITKAQKKNKGVVGLMFSSGEILADLEHHGDKSMWAWLPAMKHRKGYDWVYPSEN